MKTKEIKKVEGEANKACNREEKKGKGREGGCMKKGTHLFDLILPENKNHTDAFSEGWLRSQGTPECPWMALWISVRNQHWFAAVFTVESPFPAK